MSNEHLTPEQRELAEAARREQERKRRSERHIREQQKRNQEDLGKPPADDSVDDLDFL